MVFSRVPKRREVDQQIGVSSIGFMPETYDNDLRFSAHSAGDGLYVFPYKNEILGFYTDNENNLKHSLTEMPSSSDKIRKLVLVAATISNEGTVNREIVIDLKDDDFLALPMGIRYMSPTILLIPIRRVTRGGIAKDDFRWGNIEIL